MIPLSGWSNLKNWGGINIGTFVVNVQISWFDWYWDSYFGAENGGGYSWTPTMVDFSLDYGVYNNDYLSDEECDKRLAELFGGEGAVAAHVTEPATLQSPVAGTNRYTSHFGAQGVFHLYTNAEGSVATVGLYVPQGAVLIAGGEYCNDYEGEGKKRRRIALKKCDKGSIENFFRYRLSGGVEVSFVHVGGTSGGLAGGQRLGNFRGNKNSAGSIQIGTIAGIGGEGAGYNHTHIIVTQNGQRIDPKKVFCKR